MRRTIHYNPLFNYRDIMRKTLLILLPLRPKHRYKLALHSFLTPGNYLNTRLQTHLQFLQYLSNLEKAEAIITWHQSFSLTSEFPSLIHASSSMACAPIFQNLSPDSPFYSTTTTRVKTVTNLPCYQNLVKLIGVIWSYSNIILVSSINFGKPIIRYLTYTKTHVVHRLMCSYTK